MYLVVGVNCYGDIEEVDIVVFQAEYPFQYVVVINLTLKFVQFYCIIFVINI